MPGDATENKEVPTNIDDQLLFKATKRKKSPWKKPLERHESVAIK
jgi:hypothetical protein